MSEGTPVSNTWAALRQRKLVQWALAYLAVAWVLLQALGLAVESYDWPHIVMRLSFGVLALGFVATLVLAWYHGERGEQKVRGSELLILAVLLAVGGGLLWRTERVSSSVSRSRDNATHGNRLASAPETPVAPIKSIAVLPFENLSEDKANAYFADGIQDEILTRLSRISALKVISRTSTQQYASKPGNLPEIARQLGVANILEGSVQKAGDSVRINVQLIRADGDSHLWAETYDRKLTDIFGVESEVATAIAGSLQATLTGGEQRALAVMPTDNAAAYDAYLRGLVMEGSGGFEGSQRRTVATYAEAVRLDPRFALAWAHLASNRSNLYFNGVEPAENTAAAVKLAADTAIKLQPELGEAWLAQGYYRYRVLRDYMGALQAFDEARKRLPNNAQVLWAFALVERRMGRWDEAVANMQLAVQLDPRNLTLKGSLGYDFLLSMRRFAEARAVSDQMLAIDPGNPQFIAGKANRYLYEGNINEAAKLMESLASRPADEGISPVRARLYGAQGHPDAAIRELQHALPKLAGPLDLSTNQAWMVVTLGYVQLRKGDAAAARSTFERVIHSIKPTPTAAVRVDDTGLPFLLASAYAGIGDKQAALDQARKAVELYRDDGVQRPQAEFTLAQVQAWVGDTDTAIAALPHLLQVPDGVMPGELKWEPRWDPLRKDARFQELLKKVSLHHE